ncbi:MAG: DUF11 domain-containing protein [Acidobacteria bacterium]|nr:DUF11 domain-containing protein [Acidobacteriota bacterium]
MTLQLTVAVDSCTAPGAFTNRATATSMSALPAVPRNVGTDTVKVIARPDLAITKVDDPDPVIAGNTLTYTIEAINNGPSCAQDVMITDPLPQGTVFLTATPSTGGVAAGTNPAVGANGTVKYTWPGLTGPGVKRTLTITVRVCPDVACDTVLSNTATVSYTPRIPVPNPNTGIVWDVDPVTSNNTATATTTVKAQSDLSLAKSGPSSAQYSTTNQQSIVSYTLSFSNAGPSNAAGVMIVDTLPKGFTLDSWTIAAPYTVNDVTVTSTTLNGVTTVKFTLKNPLGAANQCATNFPTSGVITLKAVVPIKHPIVTVINSATISTTNCLADPNLANNTATASTFIVAPGTNPQTAYPAASEVSDIQGGSVLFYPIYTSDAVNPNKQNTRINMTNVSTTENVCVHLFAIDGATCSVLDMFVCLTPSQTISLLASDLDPGNSGYMVAVAVDCATGLPRAYNCLIGDEYVKFTSGHAANLGAEAIQALMMFPAGSDPNATFTSLKFDGMSYNRLPRVLAVDNIQSISENNQTMLVLNRVGGNFMTSAAQIGNITGLVYDDTEIGYSFTSNQGVCQSRNVLSNTFPRTLTPFNRVIPASRTGWMKLWRVDDGALFGVQINYNPNTNSQNGAFNQGHNLHALTLTDKAEIIVPVFVPTCN